MQVDWGAWPDSGRDISITEMAGIVQVYAPEQAHELLAQCDYVLDSLPSTPATHHFLDAEAFAAMKPNAVVINVGRGTTIDEAALIEGTDLKSHDVSFQVFRSVFNLSTKTASSHVTLRQSAMMSTCLQPYPFWQPLIAYCCDRATHSES